MVVDAVDGVEVEGVEGVEGVEPDDETWHVYIVSSTLPRKNNSACLRGQERVEILIEPLQAQANETAHRCKDLAVDQRLHQVRTMTKQGSIQDD